MLWPEGAIFISIVQFLPPLHLPSFHYVTLCRLQLKVGGLDPSNSSLVHHPSPTSSPTLPTLSALLPLCIYCFTFTSTLTNSPSHSSFTSLWRRIRSWGGIGEERKRESESTSYLDMTSSFICCACHLSSGASSGSIYAAAISLVTQQRRASKQPSRHAVGVLKSPSQEPDKLPANIIDSDIKNSTSSYSSTCDFRPWIDEGRARASRSTVCHLPAEHQAIELPSSSACGHR